MTKTCNICGDEFEPGSPQAWARVTCYAMTCIVEKRRRIERARRLGAKRNQGGGRLAACASCGEPPHDGRTCRKVTA